MYQPFNVMCIRNGTNAYSGNEIFIPLLSFEKFNILYNSSEAIDLQINIFKRFKNRFTKTASKFISGGEVLFENKC